MVVLGMRNGWVRFATLAYGWSARYRWMRHTSSRHLFQVRYEYAGRHAVGPAGWFALLAGGAR
jgi:hypothetical protein